ncbi:MAG: peptide deformylase [Candidatus Moranbacteria bacterium]|nr:peptide deformylase [Candidatus Moranbacteria bacterium]NTW75546.1 peptide deformylase [Candidatus Moranbacteria bacterium]
MLDIVTINSPNHDILRRRAERVNDPTETAMRTLVADMIDTMRVADGVGLAAPQIGRSIRLFVIETGGRVSVFFNPDIIRYSEERSASEEGCLSVPGQFFSVERANAITMEYNDPEGRKRRIEAEGFLAIVLQHEYDHLEGILMIDRVK